MAPQPTRLDSAGLNSPVILYDASLNAIVTVSTTGALTLGRTGGSIGFYGTTPIAKQTGVAVTAEGIHAACVALGLFAA